MHRSFKIRYIVNVKFFNIHFCSCCKFTLKVFDLQRCTIYQKIAFSMGVSQVPLDLLQSVQLPRYFNRKSSNFFRIGPYQVLSGIFITCLSHILQLLLKQLQLSSFFYSWSLVLLETYPVNEAPTDESISGSSLVLQSSSEISQRQRRDVKAKCSYHIWNDESLQRNHS